MGNPGPVVFQVIPLSAHPLWVTTLKSAFGESATRWLDGSPAALEAFANEPSESRTALRLVTGQFWLGSLRGLDPNAKVATCLREPVERMLAHYMFVKTNPRHPLHEKLHQRHMGPVEYAKSGLSLDLDNGQVRALLDATDAGLPAGTLTDAHLERAWARLESLAAFGLAERFEESVALVQLGLGTPDLSFIRDSYDWIRPVSEAFSPSEIAGIRATQWLDAELYRRATVLFDQRIAQKDDFASALDRQRERCGQLAASTRWNVEPKQLASIRPDARDVVWIASYPRSGNSWMRFLLDAYVFGAATDVREVSRLAVELDYFHNQAKAQGASPEAMLWIVREWQRQFDRRGLLPDLTFFKTHFRWSAQHPLANRTKAAIVLVRDPRDVLISGQNFSELERRANGMTPAQYADRFIQSGGDPWWTNWGCGTWEEFNQSWTTHGRFPVFLLRYEDLKENTAIRLSQTLEFLGVQPDPGRVEKAVQACAIDRLRDLERAKQLMPGGGKSSGKERYFFNQGRSGQSLRELDGSEATDLDTRFDLAFGPAMARWGYAPRTPLNNEHLVPGASHA